ncbi:hypothetical protein HPB51_004433 [Rhipicephalus microplus]|uniref:Uncharacterized protein n=1 Tax=Rhipicephalus microplus TaxID=6941 RepID=A0A9J6EMC2_RHIMP|nr:hypothetical protein HPB51_004433 [Rhipicephalus microplus]
MSNTRVKREGEKTVIYMDGQQLQGSGTNVVVSCGPGASQSRGTVYQMPNAGSKTTTLSCMGSAGSSCRTTLSMENMNEPQVLRVVPKGTTILLEEVKPPPKAQRSGSAAPGHSNHGGAVRTGSPTIQIVQECHSSADCPPPPPSRPEPIAAENCVECIAEVIERRRAGRRGSEDETVVRVTVEDEEVMPDAQRGNGCCPCCGAPMNRRLRD